MGFFDCSIFVAGDAEGNIVASALLVLISWSLYLVLKPLFARWQRLDQHTPVRSHVHRDLSRLSNGANGSKLDLIETKKASGVLVRGKFMRSGRKNYQPAVPYTDRGGEGSGRASNVPRINPFRAKNTGLKFSSFTGFESLCHKCHLNLVEDSCCHNYCLKCCSVCPGAYLGYDLNRVTSLMEVLNEAEYPAHLDLSYYSLTECPPKLGLAGANLAVLNLSNNRLTFLPNAIGLLHRLQELYLQHNSISELPNSFGSLSSLSDVDLSYNSLYTLPESIGNLRRLKYLDVNHNQLSWLPASIGNLVSLVFIDIENNYLSKLPESLGAAQSLNVLNAAKNRLRGLPATIGGLTCLKDLDCRHNLIEKLPVQLFNCTALVSLNFENNKISSIPANVSLLGSSLRYFGLKNNLIRTLPSTINKLVQLSRFNVMDNPLMSSSSGGSSVQLGSRHDRPSFVASLQEMCACFILQKNIAVSFLDVSSTLFEQLDEHDLCYECGRTVVVDYWWEVRFAPVLDQGPYPLVTKLCSPCRAKSLAMNQ